MGSPNLQIEGGNFQSALGVVLANGTLRFILSHDENASTGPSQIGSGLQFTVPLNASGSVAVSPATYIYSNDTLTPSGSFYAVYAYAADGTLAWGPQYWTFTSSPNPIDIGTIVPTFPPGSGGGGGGSTLLLETNGTVNSNQSLLNIAQGTGISISNSSGTTTISNSGGIPSGSNVWFAGYSGWINSNFAQGVWAGNTCANMLPGRLALNLPSSWKVSFESFAGNTVKIAACSICVCPADSPVVSSVTTVTFAGIGTATYTTSVTSDPIAITVTPANDYYVMVYYDPTSGNPGYWQEGPYGNQNFGAQYSSVNNTSPANILTTVSPTTDVRVYFQKITVA